VKILTMLLALVILIIPMEAAHKAPKSNKRYMQEEDIFLFRHGMYVAYPGNLYRIGKLYYSKVKGYYAYKCHMKKIPLERLDHAPWTDLVNVR
jgi:hypothetical protein